MNIKLLDRPIAFHRAFVQLTGSITGALLLSQAVYWQMRCQSEDGWWWKTQEDWEEETGMTRRELESARRACSRFVRHEVREMPAKSFYSVDVEAVESELASLAESAKQDWRKAPNKIGGKRQTRLAESANPLTTEITSETTSETTSADGAGASRQNKADLEANIPEALRTPAFFEAWKLWQKHRAEKRCRLTPTCAAAQLKMLAAIGPESAIATINRSIANGWQGLFPERKQQPGQSTTIFNQLPPRKNSGNL